MKINRNSNILIHEIAIESVVCEMAAILSQPQCVKNDLFMSLIEMIKICFFCCVSRAELDFPYGSINGYNRN